MQKVNLKKKLLGAKSEIPILLLQLNFRSRFKLRAKELEYIKDKSLDTIYSYVCDFIRDRVAPAEPANDGKQTPMRGHPVFIAQHATATCCRGVFKNGTNSLNTEN